MASLDFAKGNGLLPLVVQDEGTKVVLMLGYMDQEALSLTIKENYVWFYSRSKKRLWCKGETSGNRLRVSRIFRDCDGDTLLILATPFGPTCHEGYPSCFYRRISDGNT